MITERKLDAVPSRFHPRMLGFNLATVLPAGGPRNYTHACSAWYDQGSEGACVPHAFSHEAAAKPVVRPVAVPDIWAMYDWCRANDVWPGVDHEGTSVDAGARAARQFGLLEEWRWAENLEDALVAIGRKGPGVLGCDWHSGMWDTDGSGFIHAVGAVVGGHAILANGVKIVWQPGTTRAQRTSPGWLRYADRERSWVRLHNSWGQDWGVNGEALITLEDFETLWNAWGELCVPTRRVAA